MFLDASAMIAILANESDAPGLTKRLYGVDEIHTSPIAVYEAVLGLARAKNFSLDASRDVLDRFLNELGAEIVPITAEIGYAAVAAFDRFGKGRHVAGLNMGDCFAYACAQHLGAPLLYKGNDFSRTDISDA
jgi:ribonuclease VapC